MYEQLTVVVVNPQVPGMENVHSLNDLLAVARARPGLDMPSWAWVAPANPEGGAGRARPAPQCAKAGEAAWHAVGFPDTNGVSADTNKVFFPLCRAT